MFKLYILYAHLFATCSALGVTIAANLYLLGRLGTDASDLRTLDRLVGRLLTASLAALYVSGAGLVWLGLGERASVLLDPTLIGKLMLVGLMTANVVVLRRRVFPHLAQPASLLSWTPAQRLTLALPVALANSLWLSCAFLGYALPLGLSMSVHAALGLALLLFVLMLGGLVWRLEAHCKPRMAAPAHVPPALRHYDEHEFLAM